MLKNALNRFKLMVSTMNNDVETQARRMDLARFCNLSKVSFERFDLCAEVRALRVVVRGAVLKMSLGIDRSAKRPEPSACIEQLLGESGKVLGQLIEFYAWHVLLILLHRDAVGFCAPNGTRPRATSQEWRGRA